MEILVFGNKNKNGEKEETKTRKNIRIPARTPRVTFHPAALCVFFHNVPRFSYISYFYPMLFLCFS